MIVYFNVSGKRLNGDCRNRMLRFDVQNLSGSSVSLGSCGVSDETSPVKICDGFSSTGKGSESRIARLHVNIPGSRHSKI